MSSAQTDDQLAAEGPAAGTVDLKLEVVVIPVSDVDRAKEFYANLGWRLDADFAFENGFRIVQLTPPGSGCSIQFGAKLISASPGSAEGLYLVVSDLETARQQLVDRGVEVGEIFHEAAIGARFQLGESGRLAGLAPDHGDATARSRRSPIPTATSGSSRRSRRAFGPGRSCGHIVWLDE